jgi:hypothetical protein
LALNDKTAAAQDPHSGLPPAPERRAKLALNGKTAAAQDPHSSLPPAPQAASENWL